MNDDMSHNHEPWGSRMKLVLIGFALIGGFFLIAEHRAHVLPYLPWLFLGACLVMHMFMHGGHGHGGHRSHGGDTPDDGTARTGGAGETSHAGHTPAGDAASEGRSTGPGEPSAATPPSDHSHHHGDRRS